MPCRPDASRPPGLRSGLSFLLLLLAASFVQGEQDRTAQKKRQGAFLRDAKLCAECHEMEHEAISQGVHALVPISRGLDACETCHGPGKKHYDSEDPADITQPAKLGQAQQKALCGGCHAQQIEEHGGPLAALERAGKSCTDCHAVHESKEEIPGSEDLKGFALRKDADAKAKALGLGKCLQCHEDKERSLMAATHASLLTRTKLEDGRDWSKEKACEACHGNGEKHVETYGLTRFITRPDRSKDGTATCRSCHGEVDAEFFHWRPSGRASKDERRKKAWFGPLLGRSDGRKLRCTTCHSVHGQDDPTLHKAKPRPTTRPATQSQDSHAIDTSLDGTTDPLACARCHAPAYRVLRGTIHAQLADPMQPKGQGCVSCHPGGGRHAALGGRKDLVLTLTASPAALQTASCRSCHAKDRKLSGFSHGIHAKKNITCLHCHSPTAAAGKTAMRRDAEKNCADCHKAVAMSFRHANGHPVGEGSFGCSSCHDPHRQKRVGLRTARTASKRCVSCHREYRGPFVFPHHAMKGEGCLACHEPHGTTNPKLLKTKRVRQNCLSCHADLPNFHDQSQGSVYRNCLSCHVKLHGSNRNRFFFR